MVDPTRHSNRLFGWLVYCIPSTASLRPSVGCVVCPQYTQLLAKFFGEGFVCDGSDCTRKDPQDYGAAYRNVRMMTLVAPPIVSSQLRNITHQFLGESLGRLW